MNENTKYAMANIGFGFAIDQLAASAPTVPAKPGIDSTEVETLRKQNSEMLMAMQANWVAVTDRLPEPETDVLVRCLRRDDFQHFTVAGLFQGEWMSMETEDGTKGEVTHWMPLPGYPSADRTPAANEGGLSIPGEILASEGTPQLWTTWSDRYLILAKPAEMERELARCEEQAALELEQAGKPGWWAGKVATLKEGIASYDQRAAAARSSAEKVGDLPPLPKCKMLVGHHLDSLHVLYSADQVREIQREAYEAGRASGNRPSAADAGGLDAGRVMMSAHAFAPSDLPHPAKMRWMADYFLKNYRPTAVGAAGQGWISVEDRLPEPGGLYLVDSTWGGLPAWRHRPEWADGCFQEAISNTDEGDFDWNKENHGAFRVTHWMPMPSTDRTPANGAGGREGGAE